MRIVMKRTSVGRLGRFMEGREYTVDEATAELLLEADACVSMEPTKAPPAELEDADAEDADAPDAAETAEARPRRKRRGKAKKPSGEE